jgi:hypothetical protein
MQTIQLWTVDRSAVGTRALPVDPVASSETERMLEDLLVNSPELLDPDVTLVGRQVPTDGGPLDLLGVDGDGRLVVYELKRGTLTRDAVAQALDYASDLASMDPGRLARLIEESSGRGGIEKRTNFIEWYNGEYPTSQGPLAQAPRMVLVGLGADERARRIVNFLAQTGVDAQLLTFHAFKINGTLLLARQVESEAVVAALGTSGSKGENRRALHELAGTQGAAELLEEVTTFLVQNLPGLYPWPGKTAYSFSLPELTSEGRPTTRTYATLYVDAKQSGTLLLHLPPRTAEIAPAELEALSTSSAQVRRPGTSSVAMEVRITRSSWPSLQPHIEALLRALAHNRAAAQTAVNAEMDASPDVQVSSPGLSSENAAG